MSKTRASCFITGSKHFETVESTRPAAPEGGVLPYTGHIGMCRCEGYGFQAVYSSIAYINQSVCV